MFHKKGCDYTPFIYIGGVGMDVRVSKHSIERTKDRVGLSKKISQKNAEKALEHGLTHKELSGSIKRYVDRLYLSHGVGNNIRIYNRYVYIFQGKVLITILNLPTKYHKTADAILKNRKNMECEND